MSLLFLPGKGPRLTLPAINYVSIQGEARLWTYSWISSPFISFIFTFNHFYGPAPDSAIAILYDIRSSDQN